MGTPDDIAAQVRPGTNDVAEGDLFRAWFEKVYEPTGAFRDALLAIGVDPGNLKPHYTSKQFVETARVIRAHAHGKQDDETAYREIGRVLMRAFFQTPAGRLLGVVVRLLPTRTFLHRVPAYLRVGRPNVEVEPIDLEDGGVRLDVRDPDWCPPDVFAGVIEQAVMNTGATPRLSMTRHGGGHMELDVRW